MRKMEVTESYMDMKAKVTELVNASSVCAEAKAAGEAYLKAFGTPGQAEAMPQRNIWARRPPQAWSARQKPQRLPAESIVCARPAQRAERFWTTRRSCERF
jgi:hypothetical protein